MRFDPGPDPTRTWTVVEAKTPHDLLEATDLFDHDITPEGAADSLARPGHHVLLARASDGSAIGFISGVEMRHPDKACEMFINELGVTEAWRRQGVAHDLVRTLAQLARARGIAALWTATEPDNHAALATYRSHGATAHETAVMISIDLTEGPG